MTTFHATIEPAAEMNVWLARWDRSLVSYSHYTENPREEYPWVTELEKNADAIREEVLRYKESQDFPYRTDEAPFQDAADNNRKWQMLFLYRCGGRNAAVADLFPALDSVLKGSDYALGDVGLSLLPPSSSLTVHTGFLRAYMRVHLPLVVPKRGEANLYVWPKLSGEVTDAFESHLANRLPIFGVPGDVHTMKNVRNMTKTLEAYNSDDSISDPHKPLDTHYVKRRYKEGEVIVFDDTVMHAVENTSTDAGDVRIVVWIDIVKRYPPRLAAIVWMGLAICRNAPDYLDCLEGRSVCDR